MVCLEFESGGDERLSSDSLCIYSGTVILCSALGYVGLSRCLLLSAIGSRAFCDEHFFMKCSPVTNSS